MNILRSDLQLGASCRPVIFETDSDNLRLWIWNCGKCAQWLLWQIIFTSGARQRLCTDHCWRLPSRFTKLKKLARDHFLFAGRDSLRAPALVSSSWVVLDRYSVTHTLG